MVNRRALESLRDLPFDEVSWRKVLLEVLPAQAQTMVLIEQHLAAIELLLRAGAAPSTVLQLGALPNAAPVVTSEVLVKAVVSTPSVAVGAESEFDVELTDLWGKPIDFSHLSITEVDIAAPQLVNADDVRLRIFRTGRRRVPQDLVAEFTGTSVVAGTWQASFSNRRIEYSDSDGEDELHLAVRNSSGNSGPSTFDLRFFARAFPKTRG
jgi:hypothetical protein